VTVWRHAKKKNGSNKGKSPVLPPIK